MIEFRKLTLAQIDLIAPYFALSRTRACDNTVGGSFMWRDFFNTEYAIVDGAMFFKVNYFNDRTAFSMPLGGDVPGALGQIREYCARRGIDTVVCTATRQDVERLGALYALETKKEEDWSDYLYNASDLATMSGHRYNGQRNNMNRFRRDNADYDFRAIDGDSIPDIRRFFDEYSSSVSKDSDIFREEESKVFEVLDNYGVYRQLGLALYVSGRVAAFSIGEIVGDTLFVHIEKANTEIAGAYQMIVSEAARRSLDMGVRFINREEDVGDPGLRTSKLSYHPCELIEKYTVVILGEKGGD